MIFRSFIYLDAEKLDEYLSIIGEVDKGRKTTKSHKVGFGANAGIASANVEFTSESDSYHQLGPAAQCKLFENALIKYANEEYFDNLTQDVDLLTVPPMAIVRTQGILEVPEVFDVYKMMEGYAPMMHQLGILESGLDNKETEFVLGLFKNANYDTPAIIDCEGTRISTKLKSQYIKGGYEALEDCLDDEITVLYKVTAVRTEGNVVIFDPMKDFIKLNRALRRSMERNEQTQPITAEAPIVKAEVLAIYR